MKQFLILFLIGFLFYNCTKDESTPPKTPIQTKNLDSLARLDYNKSLSRILSANVGFCMGCHDGAGAGPGPGDFRTFDNFKITVLKPGNLVRNRGLADMSSCGNYGCLTTSQKDTLSNWLKDYFNL